MPRCPRQGKHAALVAPGRIGPALVALLASLALSTAGCSDDPALTCDPAGGAVAGDVDTHCGTTVIVLAPDECTAAADDNVTTVDPRFNAEGEDDDCKYHVTWTATPICFDATVTFEVTVAARFDNAPQVGAAPRIEAHLTNDVGHTLPESGQRTVELGGGRYEVGPVHFDASGQWEMTIHLYEECNRTVHSPRGQITFFVDVP